MPSIFITIDGIHYNATNYVLTDSLVLTYSIFKDLEPSTNRADFKLSKSSPLLSLILATTNDVLIEIKEDTTYLFKGYLTDNYSWKITNTGQQAVSISAEDFGIKLLKRNWISANNLYSLYTNLKICDSTDTTNSIIHKIAALAGVSVSSAIPTISSTLSLNIQDKDNLTYWEVLKQLTFEYGYVFYFENDGDFNIYPIAKAEIAPTATFSSTTNLITESINNGIEVNKKLIQYKQINLTWDEWETKSNIYVFRDSTGGDNNFDCNIPLAAGSYYPTGADADTFVFSEYKSETGQDIINVSTASLDYSVDSGITVEFENLGTRGKLRIHNTSASVAYIRKLKIKADSVILKKNTNVNTAGTNTAPIYKFKAKYIHDLATATAFVNTIKDYYAYSNYKYSFKSRLNVEVGIIATLNDNLFNTFNEPVLITNKELKENGICNYTAIGIDAFDLNATTSRDITVLGDINSGIVSNPRILTPSITIGTTTVDLGGTVSSVDGVEVTGTVVGNADTATKLETPRKIGIAGKVAAAGVNFDGSTDITINATGVSVLSSEVSDASSANAVNMIVKRDASGNFAAGTITAALTGNSSTSTKLATARTIGLSGKVSGLGTVFDGSANITINSTSAAITSAEITDATNLNTASMIVKRDASGGFAAGAISASTLTTSSDVVIGGNLTINGTTTTINATTLSVDDKNIELGSITSPSDATANGGGITLKGATDKTITWDSTNTNWTSSEHLNLNTGKAYKINNTSVLNATTLGAGVVNSSLTSVGTLANLTVTNTISGSISGNATTATKLATTRTIAGVSFDGSANISIPFANLSSIPTTLSGYGITDAQPLDADLSSIAGLTGTLGLLKKTAANTWSLDTNSYLTGNQTITVSGDATGSGTTSISLTLANSGATAGTYKSVTVNAKGLITSGTNPTTLSGYGITDAAPSSHIGATGAAHGIATTSVSGFLSSTDKTKLDGIATGANLYIHPTGDGNLHIPATGTTNNLKVLKAGSTAGSVSWGNVAFSEITSPPTTLSGYGITDAAASTHTHTFASLTSKPTTLSGYGITDAAASTHTHTDLTNATSANTVSTLVKRDASGGFIAGKIKGNNYYTGYDWTSKTAGFHCGTDGINGGVSFYDGTTATSASIFRDTDSKFYVGVRANVLTNGITIDTSGNVGIKNTSPTAELDITGSVKATSFTGALSGNATTATTLKTARTINGVSFNGSANITITAANPNGVVFNNSGSGAASGTTYTGASTATISYNTIGAASSGHTHTDLTNATSSNTASTLVKRDASGNFSAGTITASSLVGTLSTAAQTNITSLGTLTGLSVNGNIIQSGNSAISNNFVSGSIGTGWKLDYGSSITSKSYLEVDNLMVRDTIRTHIFQKDVVKSVNGQLYISASGVIADDFTGSYPTEKTIYFDVDKSSTFSVNDVLQIKDLSIYTGTLAATAKIRIDTVGTITNGKQPYTFTLIEGSISPAPPNLQKGMTAVKVSGGSVLLDASSTNNPFIDVIDNSITKVRVGNLAGISGASGYGLYSDNVFLTGTIVANSGQIGNWNISDTALYGGGYDASGTNLDNLPGTYLNSSGAIVGNSATFKNITIEGDSSFEGTIDTPVLKAQFLSADLDAWDAPTGTWSGEDFYQYFIGVSIYRLIPCACTGDFAGKTTLQRDYDSITLSGSGPFITIYRNQNYTYQGTIDTTVEGRLQTISLTPLDNQTGVYDITGYRTINAETLQADALQIGPAETMVSVSAGDDTTPGQIYIGSWILNGHNRINIDGNVNISANTTTWTSTASWTGSSFYAALVKAISGGSSSAWCSYDSVFNGQTVGRIDIYNNAVRIISPTSALLYTIANDNTTYTYQGTITATSHSTISSPLALSGGIYNNYGNLLVKFNNDGSTDLVPKHLLISNASISVRGNETNADLELYSQGTGNIYLNKDSYYSTGNVAIGSTSTPTEKFEVGGNIKALLGRFISTIATGTSPLSVSSTTVNTNLNADLLDGQHGSYYTTAGNLTGTISSSVLGNSTHYIGTTAIALNRGSGAQSLTGITSIDGSAAKLTTSRTIAISTGATGTATSFDGSANITIPITSLAASYLSGTIPSAVLGNSTVYIGTTAVALNRGTANLTLTGITSIDGSAAKLTTARAIAGVSFDGSANISIPFANLSSIPTTLSGYGITDAAASTHTHTDLTNATSSNTASTLVKRDASGNFSAGTITAALSGNAATATKLATARTIAGVSFNGSANISIPFANLSSIPTTLSGYGITDAAPSSHIGATGAAHGIATTSVSGFLSSTDKTKLDGIATGANNYTLPVSTTTVLGGVKIGSGVSVDGSGVISVSTAYQAPLSGTGLVKSTAGIISYDTNTYITGNQSISISGDATGSGTTSISLTLANSGVSAGTYKSVTVNAKGLITSGTNPTTLAGYGITDAATSTHNHTLNSLSNVSITSIASGELLKWNGTAWINNTLAEAGIQPAGSYLTGNQTITISGDATGSGATSISLTLANSGVSAGTYKSVTVDTKGRVTSGSNPTTLSGYGITDAATSTHTHAFASLTSKPTTLSGYGITDFVGFVAPFAGTSAPAGWLACNGQAVSRTTYSSLFAAIGTTWGVGDGTTTFNLPDLRETTLVGTGTRGSGVVEHDTYTVGQFKDDQIQNHKHNAYAVNNYISNSNSGGSGYPLVTGLSDITAPVEISGYGIPRVGTTTHGKQTGILWCIKY